MGEHKDKCSSPGAVRLRASGSFYLMRGVERVLRRRYYMR